MYKLGQARYARLLLSAPDLRRLGQASRTVAALAKIDRDKLAEHEHTLAELKTARAALEERKRQAAATRASAERAQAAALRAEQAHNDLIRDIDERRDLTAQLAGELQSAQQKLQTTLRGMPGGTSADAAVLPVRPFRGELDWPLQGDIRRRFGRTATGATSPSNGMEIGAADATTVAAIHEGVVAFAGAFTAFGNLVILDHGSDIFSVYGDLLEVGVAKGARVDRGQAVGSAGPLPGGGTGLYFELRVDGKPVDPLQWLKKKP
jgi:septal ring factor EnvC (AmiA/AmiB activator)